MDIPGVSNITMKVLINLFLWIKDIDLKHNFEPLSLQQRIFNIESVPVSILIFWVKRHEIGEWPVKWIKFIAFKF